MCVCVCVCVCVICAIVQLWHHFREICVWMVSNDGRGGGGELVFATDICQLGLDQRKVNMLAREYCEFPEVKKKKRKPIILSHHMLMGLKAGQAKMSKSDPESAIFMEDEAVHRWHVLCSKTCVCLCVCD